ncbi:MAG: class I SAM-dependent methyltransferase [bacterium]
MREWLRAALAGHRVLEVACGTGYWTGALASVAEAIVTTDPSDEVLNVASAKHYPARRVRFERADPYALASIALVFVLEL